MRYEIVGEKNERFPCVHGKYDTKRFDFVKLISGVFGVDDLSEINEVHGELFKVGNDSKTSYHEKFYNKYREGWGEMQSLYDLFIEEIISKTMNEDFLYQKFPTIRVHLKKNIAVGAFHNDSEFNHPESEINFIIPLTSSDGTASVWVESEEGKKDFSPMVLRVGEVIMFNGNKLTHGNKVNETDRTRVSMDFRILALSKYNANNESGSMTMNIKFKEGEYYNRFTFKK